MLGFNNVLISYNQLRKGVSFMKKNEVAGFLIMESTMEPSKPTNLQVYDKGGLFYVKFDTTLQEFNRQNRNRRTYVKEPMLTSLNAPHIQELLRNRTWLGEAGHPMEEDVKRILTIDPKLTSHRINSFYSEGYMLKGEVETLDDGGYGTRMTKNILQGMEPAFSLRALAPLTKRADGSSLVQAKSHIVTYDWVILPSHDKAYRDQSKPIQKVVKDIQNDGNTVTESAIAVAESQLKSFIALESANVKLVSNVCEVSAQSMSLTSDFKHAVLKEGSNTYLVNIEDKIKHEARGYFSRL